MNEKIKIYLDLIAKWNKAINLISAKDMPNIMTRHVANSLQILPYLSHNSPLPFADFGSGGGFPAIPLAIMLNKPLIMVEKDTRKAVFLREALRLCGIKGEVINDFCQNIAPINAEFCTARAFLPIINICEVAMHHCQDKNLYLLKGKDAMQEIFIAQKKFDLQYENFSLQDGGILIIIKKMSLI